MINRSNCLAAGASVIVALASQPAVAQPTGEIDILNWLGGADSTVIEQMAAGFEEQYPGVSVNLIRVTTQGDHRGGIRAALMGGEQVDLIINTWPAFRAELADAGLLRDMSDAWEVNGWDELISESWRDLSSTDDIVYGVPYIFGYRSGIWHIPADLEAIGIDAFPEDWDEFNSTFEPLRDEGFAEPIAMPAQVYAHTEWFETLLLRLHGPELVGSLAAHDVSWTDERVVEALGVYAELFQNGCCGDAQLMNATHWDGAADRLFVERSANFLLKGMWINSRAHIDYGLEPGVDYALGRFPALGGEFDDASLVDAKEMLATSIGNNPELADLFLDYMISGEGADIVAEYGFTSPSSATDAALYDPVSAASIDYVNAGPIHFVLGDLLPGDLVDEYRLALQQFIANPTEDQILPTLERIEAVAARSY